MKSAFTDIFIKRPVLAISLNLFILLIGFQSIRSLSIRQYPRSDSAVVTVQTLYIGANADLVRGFITTPLERVISSMDGIDYIESTSAQGMSTITAHLKLNFDTNAALTQVQAKVAQVKNDLPPEAEAPIINIEQADGRIASMYIGFASDKLDQTQITDYLTRVVQPKITAISGVQKANIEGARTFAMRIWLKPERMAALNISPAQVRAALASNNSLSAIGNTKGTMVSVNLTANTDLRSPQEFERLVVKEENGTIIRLSDIADIKLGSESYEQDVRFNGQPAVYLGIFTLPSANTVEVIKNVRELLPEIQRQLPSDMKSGVPYDSTEYINDAIHEVLHTLLETVGIVIVIIFLFLGSLRSVIVPVVAIPLSLIGACAIMAACGFTINLLTLLAIVLAVGIVVDDAIVMLENVERHVQEGLSPVDAAIKGARELAVPTIAMTITLAAVYAPIGFQGGLTGTLFREFAFTLAGAVLVSGVVALTLSPMMSSLLVRKHDKPTGFIAFVNRVFNALRQFYSRKLAFTLQSRPATITFAFLVMLLTVPFYMFSTKELAPREDQGVVFGIVNAAPNSTLDQTLIYTQKVQDIFASYPEMDNTFQLTGPTFGFSGMALKPWSQRTRTAQELADIMFGQMASVPGIQTIVTTPPPLPGGSDFPVEMVISSTAEPKEIEQYAGRLVGAAFKSGVFMYADTDLKFDLPQSELVIDRDKVAALNLNLSQVGNDLGTMLGGNYVNRFNIDGRSYRVIPQIKREQRLNPEQITDLYVTGPNNQVVPVSTFAHVVHSVEPRTLNRFQQLNSAKIQGAIPPGVSIDMALSVLETEAKKILPPGYSIDYAGESRQLRREGNKLVVTLMLAMAFIFLVLAAQFESFRDPFIVLLGSVPLALAGALLFVFLGFTTINIYSQVGLITLVGLIAKNGILIVEFANKLQEDGLSKLEAVRLSAETRLRPILMTSVATVVGHFPLVLVTGAGAAARNSIGIVLVTGMMMGTLFTLFIVPAIYVVFAKNHNPHLDTPGQPAEKNGLANGHSNGHGKGNGHTPKPAVREIVPAHNPAPVPKPLLV